MILPSDLERQDYKEFLSFIGTKNIDIYRPSLIEFVIRQRLGDGKKTLYEVEGLTDKDYEDPETMRFYLSALSGALEIYMEPDENWIDSAAVAREFGITRQAVYSNQKKTQKQGYFGDFPPASITNPNGGNPLWYRPVIEEKRKERQRKLQKEGKAHGQT